MQQQSAESGLESRRIIFYPGMKPGVNEQMRAMFARAHLSVLEVWEGSGSFPTLFAYGRPYQGTQAIGDFVHNVRAVTENLT